MARRTSKARAHAPAADAICVDEQVAAFVGNLPLSLAISSLLAISTFAILDPHARRLRVGVWLVCTLGYNGVRLLSVRWVCGRGPFPAASSHAALRLCVIGALAAGLLWSLVPALLLDYAAPQAPLVLVLLCGMTAGAALQGSACAAAVAALTLPVLATVIVRLVAIGDTGRMVLAFDILLYSMTVVRSTMRTQASFFASIRLREEAKGMARRLALDSAAASKSAADYFRLATHDPLTGVANRASFREHLDAWLADAGAETRISLFLIDLDQFKAINDTLGHAAGDEVLVEVARRLRAVVGADGLIARLGGDEFVVLERCDAAHAEAVAAAIIDCGRAAVTLAAGSVSIGLSLGLAAYPEDGAQTSVLLKRADLALYSVKRAGRAGWRRFDAALLHAAERAHDVEQDLVAALRDEALEVWFQPQVALASGRLTGLEALIRWNHPRHGWIAPPMIVDAALKARVSDRLTGLVLARACETLRELDALRFPDAIVAVNVSPREIGQYDLAALVDDACTAQGVDRTHLELEITEEHLLEDIDSIATLAAIARTGVRLAVDDFGAGCASLTYLRNLRLDRIKIDRCFVTGLAERPGDQVLVQAILGIGRALGVEVIAEGVESHEDALMLSSLGCHLAQGYYFGAPAPVAALVSRLASPQRLEAASITRGAREYDLLRAG